MQRGAPFLIRRGAPETLGGILQPLPPHEEKEAARSLHAALDAQRGEAGARGDERFRLVHRREKGLLLPGNDLEQGMLCDHLCSSRSRNAGSVAASMAVQARATAPSRTAASADGVMQAAANSG